MRTTDVSSQSCALRQGISYQVVIGACRIAARVTGYSAHWIGQIARRYNAQGPEGMRNRQHATSRRAVLLLSPALQEELRQGLAAWNAGRSEHCHLDPDVSGAFLGRAGLSGVPHRPRAADGPSQPVKAGMFYGDVCAAGVPGDVAMETSTGTSVFG
jgi:hypothetical protein